MAAPADGQVPCVEVLEGRSKGKVFALERVRAYVVGRLPGAEIHIDDPGVSRRHVKLTRRADGSVEASDMRSTNGLVVNDERLDRKVLCESDRITLGPDAVLALVYRKPDDLRATIEPRAAAPVPNDGAQAWPGPAPAPTPPRIEDLPLSARQLEVSRLVATGMTNAKIAEALGISPRTVTSHLDHIYGRLEIGSRAALTRWIVERGLA